MGKWEYILGENEQCCCFKATRRNVEVRISVKVTEQVSFFFLLDIWRPIKKMECRGEIQRCKVWEDSSGT